MRWRSRGVLGRKSYSVSAVAVAIGGGGGRGRVLVIVVVEATAFNLGGVSSVIQAGGLSGGNGGGLRQRDQQVESRTHAFGQGDGGQFQGIH